jgi:Ribosomal protein L23
LRRQADPSEKKTTHPPLFLPLLQLELKEYLTKVYGLNVASLRTSVLAGRKKRGKHGAYARPDVKKVYVTLKN